jgi:hypothetical protein
MRELLKLSASCCYKVSNGMTIQFWLNRWFSSAPLRMLFPHLFRLSGHQNATIREVYNSNINLVTLACNRPLRDRECQQLESLLAEIERNLSIFNLVDRRV